MRTSCRQLFRGFPGDVQPEYPLSWHCVQTGRFDSDYTALIGVSASELEKASIHHRIHFLYSESELQRGYVNCISIFSFISECPENVIRGPQHMRWRRTVCSDVFARTCVSGQRSRPFRGSYCKSLNSDLQEIPALEHLRGRDSSQTQAGPLNSLGRKCPS